MQLPLTVDVLVPLGVGAVVVAVALVVVILIVRRKRSDDTPEPNAADWTGEAATRDPEPTRRATVAEATAGRTTDTSPMPVTAGDPWARRGSPGTAPDSSAPADPVPVVPDQRTPDAPVPTVAPEPRDSGGTGSRPDALSDPADVTLALTPPARTPMPDPASSAAARDDAPAASDQPSTPPPHARSEEAGAGASTGDTATPDPAPPSPDRPGSGRTVAAAVANALAARAAAGRVGGPDRASGDPNRPPARPSPQAVPPVPRGDVRDRLLAVLLDDPVRAVGAALELEACRGQLDRLSDAVRHERRVLGDVLNRLAATGLRPEQLARLAGLRLDEVRALLGEAAARTS